MKIHFRINKSGNRDSITIFVLLIMASGGLTLTSIGATSITLFYLVGAMAIVSWLIKHPHFDKFQVQIILWSGVTIGISFALPKVAKLISILHFAFYVLAAVSILGVFRLSTKGIEKLTKILIYANLLNVLIAITFYKMDKSIPAFCGTYYGRGVMRYMGFTSEPSYLAMESTVCMLAYIATVDIDSDKPAKEWRGIRNTFIAYIILIVLSRTSLGLLSIVFVGAAWFQNRYGFRRSNSGKIICFFVGVIVIVMARILIINHSDSTFLARILAICNVFFKSRSIHEFQTSLRIIDSSAWYRVGPLLLALDNARWSSFEAWFGHGIGADAKYYSILTGSDTLIRGGFLQAGFYNQGLLGLVSFCYIVQKRLKGTKIIDLAYLIVCFCNCSIATQAFWFILIVYIYASKTKEVGGLSRSLFRIRVPDSMLGEH